jgi:hypothetical protein
MRLTKPEMQRSLRLVKAAFPCFTGWKHVNETNEDYSGFCLWGEFVPDPEEQLPRSFFVTFDTGEGTWAGHLTVGQHCYFWSSADVGDAHLLDTGPCSSLEDAIATLKGQIADLFTVLSGSSTAPDRSGRKSRKAVP